MITTSSFPNTITAAPNEEMERNSLTKEDLEGGVKKNIIPYQDTNGGACQKIEL